MNLRTLEFLKDRENQDCFDFYYGKPVKEKAYFRIQEREIDDELFICEKYVKIQESGKFYSNFEEKAWSINK